MVFETGTGHPYMISDISDYSDIIQKIQNLLSYKDTTYRRQAEELLVVGAQGLFRVLPPSLVSKVLVLHFSYFGLQCFVWLSFDCCVWLQATSFLMQTTQRL